MSESNSHAGTSNQEPVSLLAGNIFKHLDEHFYGHEQAKRSISLGYYKHMKRMELQLEAEKHPEVSEPLQPRRRICIGIPEELLDDQLGKENMLLFGPKGYGKLDMAKSAAEYLKIPYAVCDCATLTRTSALNGKYHQVLADLHEAAKFDEHKTNWGVVILDNLDKIPRNDPLISNHGRTPKNGEEALQIQTDLLELIKGKQVQVPYNRESAAGLAHIDTTNILFIGTETETDYGQIQKRYQMRQDIREPMWTVLSTRYEALSLRMPELTDSFAMVIIFKPLDALTLANILTKPTNAIINQYKKLFEMRGVELSFEQAAIEELVKIALYENGKRNLLTGVLQEVLSDVMFSASGSTPARALVTRDAILGKSKVQLTYDRGYQHPSQAEGNPVGPQAPR